MAPIFLTSVRFGCVFSYDFTKIYNSKLLYLLCFCRVCDVITPEVEIGGQFRKDYWNGKLISYNLDCYGFCVTSQLTNLWTKKPLRIRVFWSNWL